MNKSNIISHIKTLTVYTLILSTVAGFLLYHMEKEARKMERETYKEQIQELKDKNGKVEDILLTK